MEPTQYAYEAIVGNQNIIKSLKAAVSHRRASHAYIFEGAPGMGKKLLANTFAKALECENSQSDGSPCGSCHSCLTFESGNHTDLFRITPAKASIGVEEIREGVVNQMTVLPYRHPYKIFLIDHAEKMTPQAQNALLKLLEEPHDYGKFLFLTQSTAAMLPTILSRCALYNLKPLPAATVKDYLIGRRQVAPALAQTAAVYSQGSIGQALAILSDEEFINLRSLCLDMLWQLHRAGPLKAFAFSRDLEGYKERIQSLLDMAYLWYRDVMTTKEAKSLDFVLQQDYGDRIWEEANRNTMEELIEKLEAVFTAKAYLKSNGNFQLTMENLLIKLAL